MIRDPHRYLEIYANISRAVYRGDSLEDILSRMVTQIAQGFGAKGCSLRVMDPYSRELTLMASYGLSRAYLAKGAVRAGAGQSLSEIHEQGPVVIHNAEQDRRVQYPDAARAEGIRTILGFPFEIMGDTRMILRLYFDHQIDFSLQDLQTINVLAEQGAITLRNSLVHTRYFEAFRTISKAIHAGSDIDTILATIVGRVTDIMGATGAIFWIVDEKNSKIRSCVCHGFHYRSLLNVDYPTLERLFDVRRREPVCIKNAKMDERIPDLERLGKRRVTTIWGVPLEIVGRYAGILAVYFGQQRNLVSSEINFLTALGEQGAIALHKTLRYDEGMLKALSETVEGLALALEAKDPTTHGHSQKVASYARLTAKALGLDAQEIATVHRAGLLHDIGKIGMHDRLIGRLGKLNAKEFTTLKIHPVIGARILEPLTFLEDVVPYVLNHHEQFDGGGYPNGIKGEAIPLGARILAVCDAFETMISGRPQMLNMPVDKALRQLVQQAGTRFDPAVVSALVTVIRENPDAAKPLKPGDDYLKRFKSKITARKAPGDPVARSLLKFITSF